MKYSKDAKTRIASGSELKSSGCWLWRGTITENGYGKLFFRGIQILAHRLSYEAHVGPVPEGLELDHLCRVRACCNPRHLEAVTRQENVRRGDSGKYLRARDACPSGHAYSEENVYLYQGRRYCRACRRSANEVRRKQAQKAERNAA